MKWSTRLRLNQERKNTINKNKNESHSCHQKAFKNFKVYSNFILSIARFRKVLVKMTSCNIPYLLCESLLHNLGIGGNSFYCFLFMKSKYPNPIFHLFFRMTTGKETKILEVLKLGLAMNRE